MKCRERDAIQSLCLKIPVHSFLPPDLFLCPLLECSSCLNEEPLFAWLVSSHSGLSTGVSSLEKSFLSLRWPRKSFSHSVITLFCAFSSQHLPWSEISVCLLICCPLLTSLKPETGSVLLTAQSTQEQCPALGRPLINIYWMNKWTKLKRVEVKYQRLKMKWPCLCVFLNS